MTDLFPKLYDIAMKPLERSKFKTIRKGLIQKATGRVLEIGAGTGINFPYYKDATHIDAIEPNINMRNKSLKKIKKSNIPIETYLVQAEKLPFSNNSFDSVVATLVFCTIDDPGDALREIIRVSKPGAKILIFEHVKLENKFLAKMQDVLTPIWKKACDGCHLNRDTLDLLKKSNLSILGVKYYFKGLFVVVECTNNKI